MKNIVSILTLAIAVLAIPGAVLGQGSPDLTTVPSVDLDRYAGRWYEIAKYPNKFQKQCVGNTTATYTRKKEGKIEVVNECLKKDGTVNRAKGEAKIVDNATKARLKVRFAPAFLSFLPNVWGDYWVIDLASDYEYAVIGEPEREYLWILSRKPEMSDAQYQEILKRVEDKGFVSVRIERTAQNLVAGKGTVLNGG